MTTNLAPPAAELAPNKTSLIDKRPSWLIGRTWPIDSDDGRHAPDAKPHPYAQRIAADGAEHCSAYRDDSEPGEQFGPDGVRTTTFRLDRAPADGRATDHDKYVIDPPRHIAYTGPMPRVSRGPYAEAVAGLGMMKRSDLSAFGGPLRADADARLADHLDQYARETVMSPPSVFVDTGEQWHRADIRAARPAANPCVWPPTNNRIRTAGGTVPAYKPGTGRPANRRNFDACRAALLDAMADSGLTWAGVAPSKRPGRDQRVSDLVEKLAAEHDRRDIAQAMGCSLNTIKRHLSAATQPEANVWTKPTFRVLTPREMAERTDAHYWRPGGPNKPRKPKSPASYGQRT